MKTLKSSRDFHGPVISLRALCQLEDRPVPYSVADVVDENGSRSFSGQLSSGDVTCTWRMIVWRNGFWSVTADFHDGGTLAGDFFFAEFLLVEGRALGVKLEGSILNLIDSRDLSLSKDGSDRRVRENWHLFEAAGPSVRLHAAPAVAALVASPIVALASAPFVVFMIGAGVVVGVSVIGNLMNGGSFEIRRCRGFRDPRENSACIEIVPVGPPPNPGEPPSSTGQPPP